eukprot:gene28962-38000_t
MIPFVWNPVVAFISSFMTVFASVIAVTKDLPDIEGDKKYNISTFASSFGVKKIANVSSFVLGIAYLAAIALPFTPGGRKSFNLLPMAVGHSVYLAYFVYSYLNFQPERTLAATDEREHKVSVRFLRSSAGEKTSISLNHKFSMVYSSVDRIPAYWNGMYGATAK